MIKKRTALAVSAAILFGLGAFSVWGPGPHAAFSGADPVPPEQKNETVYADTGPGGKVNSIIVSAHLIAPEGAQRLIDRSDLTGIKAVTQGANPVVDGDTVLWQADGKDVYYQGASLNALPVECSFTYTLDGKPIAPDALAGKSGRVTITGKYANFERHMEHINGSLEELYTPFTMITTVDLPSDSFTDVSVDNGKLIDQGDSVMAVGFGLPGLAESLNIEDDALGISDTFSITANVKHFSLDAMSTLAVPGILTAEDIGDADFFDSLQSDLDDLDSGGQALSDAADAYQGGMSEFDRKLALYLAGLEDVENGIEALENGISESASGSDGLQKGGQALTDAIEDASGDTGALDGVDTQIASLNDLAESLNTLSGLLASLQPLSSTLSGLTPVQLADLGIDPAWVAALQAAVDANADLAASATGLQTLAAQLQAALGDLTPLLDSLPALASSAQALADGLGDLSDGLTELEKGAAQLAGALKQLSAGGDSLSAGSDALAGNAAELASGVEQYTSGVHEFTEGMNGSIDDFNARKDAVLALGEAYDNFSLLPEGCEGSVRFVFTTDPVKAF